MAIGAAGVNAERQAVALRRRIDRPVLAPTERGLAHRRHQHLDEAGVFGATLDFLDRVFDVLQRHDDRGGEARVAVEPFRGDPVIDGPGKGPRHVFVEDQRHAIEAIAKGMAGAPAPEHLGLQVGETGRGLARGIAQIGPRRDRRLWRVADAVERTDAAILDRIAPELRKMGPQRLHAGHRRMLGASGAVFIAFGKGSVVRPTSSFRGAARRTRNPDRRSSWIPGSSPLRFGAPE
jgi:hypothetical protein